MAKFSASPSPTPFSGLLALFVSAAAGGVLGATLMALGDPASGRRRRGEVADRARHLWAVLRRRGDRQLRHLGNQVQGQLAGKKVRRDKAPDDARLQAQARSALGRLCEDAQAIEVRVAAGVVELHGEVPHHERRRVVRGIGKLYGVVEVRSFLRPYQRLARDEAAEVVVH